MAFKNKRILVTGGTGFIGSHIVDAVLKMGAEEVIAVDNFVNSSKKNVEHLINEPRFKLVEADISDYNSLKNVIQGCDYIFHEAASKMVVSFENPMIDFKTNLNGTFNILELCRKYNEDVKIIHASTGSVYGTSDVLMKENHPKEPLNFYGVSKLGAEMYCQQFYKIYGLKIAVLRYFSVFGPRQSYTGRAGVVGTFLYNAFKGEPLVICGSGEQRRSFTYVDNVVNANILVSETNKAFGNVYNVACNKDYSIKEIAEMIINKYSNVKIKYTAPRQGDAFKPLPDTSKIRELGFKETVQFEQGLKKTAEWVKSDMKKNS